MSPIDVDTHSFALRVRGPCAACAPTLPPAGGGGGGGGVVCGCWPPSGAGGGRGMMGGGRRELAETEVIAGAPDGIELLDTASVASRAHS